MNKFIVKELKKVLEKCNDDTIVCMERIEDVYFNKNGWQTKNVVYQRNDKGDPIDEADYFEASGTSFRKNKNELIIMGHY